MNNFIEANSKGQTYIDNEYLYDNRLTSTEKTLYAILCTACYADKYETFVGQSTLAKAINKSVRTVQRAIKRLKELGYILIRRRGSISSVITIVAKKGRQVEQKVVDKAKNAYNSYKSNKKDNTFSNYTQRQYTSEQFAQMEQVLLE